MHFLAPQRLCLFLLLPVLTLGIAFLPAADEGKEKPKPKRVEEEDDAPPKAKKPPRTEEEDADKSKPKKVIRVEDDDEPATKEKSRPAPAAVANLSQAARAAKHSLVKQLFLDLAEPHDLLYFSTRAAPIQPIEHYLADDARSLRGTIKVTELKQDSATKEWKPDRAYPNLNVSSIQKVTPYELIARQKVAAFLESKLQNLPETSPRYLSRYDQLLAAEQALGVAMRFHDSARESGVRKGEAWDTVETGLRKALLDVLVEQLDTLVDASDWDAAFALTARLAGTYPGLEEQKVISKPVGRLLKQALNKGIYTDDKLREIRQRLRQLEEQFPNSEAVRPITESLKSQAENLRDEAIKLKLSDVPRAQALLRQAEDTYPHLPGLRDLRLELEEKHPVLRVGVPALPRFLSPEMATTDTELQGVELLFEGLVKLSPDASGVSRFRAGLSEGRPRVIELGRRFYLPRNAYWANTGDEPAGAQPKNILITPVDVRSAVAMLKQGPTTHGPITGRPPAWGELLKEIYVGGVPGRVDVHLEQGFLDPLATMTFKIVPEEARTRPKEFAQKPFGTGPYRYLGVKSLPDANRSDYVLFRANPGYGSRSGALGLPRIREIHLLKTENPAQDFSLGRIDMALNLTSEQFAAIRKQQMALGVTDSLPGPGASNRRVYYLAVNHRHVVLGNADFRQALSLAINREKLLDDCFRAGLARGKAHKAINSPFPAGSWPCDPLIKSRAHANSQDPFDKEQARRKANMFKTVLKDSPLTLKYPNGNPDVTKSMEAICTDVREVFGFEALKPVAVDPHVLREDVEQTQTFELAYCWYDFPDDTFWLTPLLFPRGMAAGAASPLGYQGDVCITLLDSMKRMRDFDRVRQAARQLHRQLIKDVPVIPLWQLDPFHAFTAAVKTAPYDPLLVFTDAEEWRLNRK